VGGSKEVKKSLTKTKARGFLDSSNHVDSDEMDAHSSAADEVDAGRANRSMDGIPHTLPVSSRPLWIHGETRKAGFKRKEGNAPAPFGF
jgi:hypothetical protein